MSPQNSPTKNLGGLRAKSLRKKISESGMTIVELMIAMVISSVVVFFLFSIQTKMSRAYHGQGTVSEINQNLQAAKQRLITEMRMAGFGLGATGEINVADAVEDNLGTPTNSAFTVANNAYGDGNDSFRFLFSDPNGEVLVTGWHPTHVDYDNSISTPNFPDGTPVVIRGRNSSCLVAKTGVNVNKVHFNNTPVGAPYNEPNTPHCDPVRNDSGPYRMSSYVARSYRIDPNRDQGYLQVSPSGEVVPNDWVDLGVGFTNLQIATRYLEPGDLVDLDGDGDPERDWYSGDNQAIGDPSRPANAVLIQASISIEARSPFGTRGAAASSATPAFIDLANPDNNDRGDWGVACPGAGTDPCGVHLAITPDAARPTRYQGEFIYRSTTSVIDLRNMGVGQ